MCVFIDGLDEIEDHHERLIDIAKELVNEPYVKICLSSRPLPAFVRAFQEMPGLRLQDLTYPSIKAFAEYRVHRGTREQDSPFRYTNSWIDDIAENMVTRANGVFLWAVIVCRNVCDGMLDMVDPQDLIRLVDDLPSEIESLYIVMLRRIKPIQRKNAAIFIQIVLYAGTPWNLPLCDLYFIHLQQVKRDAPSPYGRPAIETVVAACRILKTQLLSHTAGLLELTRAETGPLLKSLPKEDASLLRSRISFLHRTASDFMSRNAEAQSFLAQHGLRKSRVHLDVAQGLLAQYHQLELTSTYNDVATWLARHQMTLHHITIGEELLGSPQCELMSSFQSHVGPKFDYDDDGLRYQCWINESGSMIDWVGLAANMGMTLYVQQRLGLLDELGCRSFALPGNDEYKIRSYGRSQIIWLRPKQTSEYVQRLMRPSSDYRQVLRECLQLETLLNHESEFISAAEDNIVESYILSCCNPWRIGAYSLIQAVLRAGADPMVRVNRNDCFWGQWLANIEGWHLNSKSSESIHQHRAPHEQYMERMSLTTVFNITKALIKNGADVNFRVGVAPEYGATPLHEAYVYGFRRRGLTGPHAYPILDVTAMFILEECFGEEPEFQEFVEEINRLVEKPCRKLVGMGVAPTSSSNEKQINTSHEDCEGLWSLILRWEESGYAADMEALKKELQRIRQAYDDSAKVGVLD